MVGVEKRRFSDGLDVEVLFEFQLGRVEVHCATNIAPRCHSHSQEDQRPPTYGEDASRHASCREGGPL